MLALSSRLLLSQHHHRFPPVTIMLIYPDLISQNKMFFNIYKIREIVYRLCLGVEGKTAYTSVFDFYGKNVFAYIWVLEKQ